MNRFAFPSEWMAKNWSQKMVAEEETSPQAGFVPVIEIRIAGVVIQVAGRAGSANTSVCGIEQAGAHATLYRMIDSL